MNFAPSIYFWKRLFAGTLPANKKLFAGTPTALSLCSPTYFTIHRIRFEKFLKVLPFMRKDRQLCAVIFFTTRKCLILYIRMCLK